VDSRGDALERGTRHTLIDREKMTCSLCGTFFRCMVGKVRMITVPLFCQVSILSPDVEKAAK
jgi:hypothetical protein